LPARGRGRRAASFVGGTNVFGERDIDGCGRGATVETFTRFVFAAPGAPGTDIAIAGHADAVQQFSRLIHALADVVGRP
jgi:hypothetical protein